MKMLGSWKGLGKGEFVMTEEQEAKCHAIIHTHAVAAAAANAAPVPGLGVATDLVSMTTMAVALANVFGADMEENAAKNLAIATIKTQTLKQPIKTIAKEASKLLPGLGQFVAPTLSLGMLESAGWLMAKNLERRYGK